MAAFGEPRVQFAQPASPDIRLGILTRDPASHLNRELGASIAGRASPAVRLQYVFFSDESRQRGADIVALDRPAWVTAENVCVAKILEWLAHARRTSAATPYVGWLDSDTWLDPQRFAVYFSHVARRAAGSPSWGGLVEHMADYDVTDPLNCPGFAVHLVAGGGRELPPAAAAQLDDVVHIHAGRVHMVQRGGGRRGGGARARAPGDADRRVDAEDAGGRGEGHVRDADRRDARMADDGGVRRPRTAHRQHGGVHRPVHLALLRPLPPGARVRRPPRRGQPQRRQARREPPLRRGGDRARAVRAAALRVHAFPVRTRRRARGAHREVDRVLQQRVARPEADGQRDAAGRALAPRQACAPAPSPSPSKKPSSTAPPRRPSHSSGRHARAPSSCSSSRAPAAAPAAFGAMQPAPL